jgi:antitoxin CptB
VKTEIPARLRWSCRRGMLELDVLLGKFLEEAFLTSSEQEQAMFVQFIDNNDQDLFNWLTGKEVPADPDSKIMAEKVRFHAKNRH